MKPPCGPGGRDITRNRVDGTCSVMAWWSCPTAGCLTRGNLKYDRGSESGGARSTTPSPVSVTDVENMAHGLVSDLTTWGDGSVMTFWGAELAERTFGGIYRVGSGWSRNTTRAGSLRCTPGCHLFPMETSSCPAPSPSWCSRRARKPVREARPISAERALRIFGPPSPEPGSYAPRG